MNQLKRSGHLNARELRHWFAWIINDAVSLVTGDPGRKLKDTGTRKDSIIVSKQRTYAVIECVMHYEPGAGTAPEVDKLSHVFKGITFQL